MGAAAARRLARDGFRIAILSSSGKGEALAGELGGVGVTGSNQSEDDLKRLVDATMQRYGRIDALVNSAGHGPRAPILELTDEQWRTGMDVYFMNVVRPTRLVTPIMVAQGGGAIVNVSTFAAFEPDPVFPTSGVFRAGLAAFTKLFADRYAPDNVRMNNVLPGFIDSLPEQEQFRERIPMGRYGRVEEVAELIALLASDRVAYLTGQNIRIDGGITRVGLETTQLTPTTDVNCVYGRRMRPPSTTTFEPVTKSDSIRKRTARHTSAGSPMRPRAVSSLSPRTPSGMSTGPGATPHTRTPSLPHASASDFTIWICAAFAPPCGVKSGQACRPATSVIATITPPPDAAICRCAAWAANMKPLAVESNAASKSSSVTSSGRTGRKPAEGQ